MSTPFLYIGGAQSFNLGNGVFSVEHATGFVDSDGTGPHADKHDAQGQTTYQPSLNASVDSYVCCPPQFRQSQDTGIVIGCYVLVELLDVNYGHVIAHADAVCADIEPRDKWGEYSIKCASLLGQNPSPVSGGTTLHRVRFTYHTGQAAHIYGKQYRLQPA